MPTRRNFLGSLPCAAILVADLKRAHAGMLGWQGWLDRYVQDGRVIDWQQDKITHSEGQGYGLLLAQAHGDRSSFDAIEDWTMRHLAVRKDNLMAWAWRPQTGGVGDDLQTATDGDLFRAWALLRASRDSGWSGYADTAIAIAQDIAELCLVPDPRAPNEYLLGPASDSRRSLNRVLVNPSYFMSRALRELGDAAGDTRLIRAADHGETVLTELAGTGLLPNWIDITATGFEKPAEHELLWGYDALRIPLYLSWSGRRDHAAVSQGLDLLTRSTVVDHLATQVADSGHILTQSSHQGYHAIVALAACQLQSFSNSFTREASYYPDTLMLLASVAVRESGCLI